jgi:hypothetical protein
MLITIANATQNFLNAFMCFPLPGIERFRPARSGRNRQVCESLSILVGHHDARRVWSLCLDRDRGDDLVSADRADQPFSVHSRSPGLLVRRPAR